MTRNIKGQFIDGDSSGAIYRFKLGQEPWNKGKTGYMGANATSFKTGQTPASAHPVGTVTRYDRTKRGLKEISYSINIDWKGNRKPHNNYRWYLWEVENLEDRPKNAILYIKNGNPDDIWVDNFEVIDRAELLRRNRP